MAEIVPNLSLLKVLAFVLVLIDLLGEVSPVGVLHHDAVSEGKYHSDLVSESKKACL